MTIKNVIEEINNSLSSKSFLSTIDKKTNFPVECNSSLIPIFIKILSLLLNKPLIYINNSEDNCIDILNWTKNLSINNNCAGIEKIVRDQISTYLPSFVLENFEEDFTKLNIDKILRKMKIIFFIIKLFIRI